MPTKKQLAAKPVLFIITATEHITDSFATHAFTEGSGPDDSAARATAHTEGIGVNRGLAAGYKSVALVWAHTHATQLSEARA